MKNTGLITLMSPVFLSGFFLADRTAAAFLLV